MKCLNVSIKGNIQIGTAYPFFCLPLQGKCMTLVAEYSGLEGGNRNSIIL
ncbi:hypothetical protein SRABI133_01315 [Peribacillus simplex]|uniref:Uncharacterized protein n=1 Tax=Peribacillus simplex TaxID=1478 RepID=A0A9W4KS32_9BACI|nr:hypothetical protein SRABI133_01315 [Peribacillus simplex]